MYRTCVSCSRRVGAVRLVHTNVLEAGDVGDVGVGDATVVEERHICVRVSKEEELLMWMTLHFSGADNGEMNEDVAMTVADGFEKMDRGCTKALDVVDVVDGTMLC